MNGKISLIFLGIILTMQLILADPRRFKETVYTNDNGQTVVENRTITVTKTNSPSNEGNRVNVQSESNYTKTYDSKLNYCK